MFIKTYAYLHILIRKGEKGKPIFGKSSRCYLFIFLFIYLFIYSKASIPVAFVGGQIYLG